MAVTPQILLLEGIVCMSCKATKLHCIINFTCSNGTCHKYLGQSNLCNKFHKSMDYIFTTMDQSFLSDELDGRVLPYLIGDDEECGDLISRVLCHYFFAPCGANGLLHLPLAVCPDECIYVQSACSRQWGIVNSLLSIAKVNMVNCTNGSLLQGLAPCCIDAGIEIKSMQTLLLASLIYIGAYLVYILTRTQH